MWIGKFSNMIHNPDCVNNEHAKIHTFAHKKDEAGWANAKEKYWYAITPAVMCHSTKTAYVIGSVLKCKGNIFINRAL